MALPPRRMNPQQRHVAPTLASVLIVAFTFKTSMRSALNAA